MNGFYLFYLLIGVLWGIAENRLWKERGEDLFLHFKWYHIFMLTLFAVIASTSGNPLFVIFYEFYTVLILDVVWWLIRYWDITHGNNYYGEPNAWHLKTDWDNFGGFPIYGCYLWWYIFAVISAVLGGILFL